MSFGVERKLAKRLVSFQEPVQRLELTEIVSRQGPSLVIADETSEPLAQRPRLVRQLVEFARTSLRPKRSQGVLGTSLAWSNQFRSPSPLSIQSTTELTGVAIEFRKSRPGESATKIAAGRRSIWLS